MISSLQAERDLLKDHICSIEGALGISEKEFQHAYEVNEEVNDKLIRDAR